MDYSIWGIGRNGDNYGVASLLTISLIPTRPKTNSTQGDRFDPSPAPNCHFAHELFTVLASVRCVAWRRVAFFYLILTRVVLSVAVGVHARPPPHHPSTPHTQHNQAHPPFKKAWLQAVAHATERSRADTPLDALARLAGEGKLEGIFFGTKHPWLVPGPYNPHPQPSPAAAGGGGGGNGAAAAADVLVGVRFVWCVFVCVWWDMDMGMIRNVKNTHKHTNSRATYRPNRPKQKHKHDRARAEDDQLNLYGMEAGNHLRCAFVFFLFLLLLLLGLGLVRSLLVVAVYCMGPSTLHTHIHTHKSQTPPSPPTT